MLPIYFGDSEQALFGIYHPPRKARTRPISAVVCHPFGNEYVGAYRTTRVLAEQLSESGISVLRFDYFGTGDSSGASNEVSISQWLKDIDAAIAEVQGASGADRTSLIGVRLGGTLAALAAAPRDDIDRVVLWEPVLNGQKHVETHLARHKAWLKEGRCPPEDSTGNEALGHPLADSLMEEICGLRIPDSETDGLDKVLLLFHSEERKQSAQALSRLGRHVDQQIISSTDFWLGRTGFDQPLVPREDVQSIVAWLTGES